MQLLSHFLLVLNHKRGAASGVSAPRANFHRISFFEGPGPGVEKQMMVTAGVK